MTENILQKHEFYLASQEKVDGLTKLLAEILPQIQVIGKGHAWRETTGPDFAEHELLTKANNVIGHYNFEKIENNGYKIVLDLSGFSPQDYETLARILLPRFPEIQFPVYTRHG